MNFIKTKDEGVARELRQSGFTELGKEGDFYCFINDGNKKTFDCDNKKIIQTNVLAMSTP